MNEPAEVLRRAFLRTWRREGCVLH